MNNIQKRFILFLFLCIPARIGLSLLAKKLKERKLQIMGLILLIPAIGFLTIYFSNIRKVGAEVFGDKIWWNDLRLLHGLLYLTFCVCALLKNTKSWLILMLDVYLGLYSFFVHHHNEGNFKKLLKN